MPVRKHINFREQLLEHRWDPTVLQATYNKLADSADELGFPHLQAQYWHICSVYARQLLPKDSAYASAPFILHQPEIIEEPAPLLQSADDAEQVLLAEAEHAFAESACSKPVKQIKLQMWLIHCVHDADTFRKRVAEHIAYWAERDAGKTHAQAKATLLRNAAASCRSVGLTGSDSINLSS